MMNLELSPQPPLVLHAPLVTHLALVDGPTLFHDGLILSVDIALSLSHRRLTSDSVHPARLAAVQTSYRLDIYFT